MDENLINDLKSAAESFDSASKYQYSFTIGRNKKRKLILTTANTEEFTHIVGLDHVPSVKQIVKNSAQSKHMYHSKILNSNFSISDFDKDDIDALTTPIAKSFNPSTQKGYTIAERIKRLSNFEEILDTAAEKGAKIYSWNLRNCNIRLPNGKKRDCQINADFVLAIPSDIPDEKIYIFLKSPTKLKKKIADYGENEPIKLFIYSAFADFSGLTNGQERPFTILSVTKTKCKERDNTITLFPNISSPNIKNIQFTTPDILPSPSGAAAIPSPMDNLVKGLSDAAEKLHNFFASFLPKPKRSPRPRTTSVKAEQTRSPEQSAPKSESSRQDAPKAFAVRRSQIKEIAGKQAETPHVQRSRDKKQNIEQ